MYTLIIELISIFAALIVGLLALGLARAAKMGDRQLGYFDEE